MKHANDGSRSTGVSDSARNGSFEPEHGAPKNRLAASKGEAVVRQWKPSTAGVGRRGQSRTAP